MINNLLQQNYKEYERFEINYIFGFFFTAKNQSNVLLEKSF